MIITSLVILLSSCQSQKGDTINYNNDSISSDFSDTDDTESKKKLNSAKIVHASDFSDERAWIQYSDENGTHIALIDTSGSILYNNDFQYEYNYQFSLSLHDMVDGLSIIEEPLADSSTIKKELIIDKTGKIIKSTESGDFDNVLATGNGVALVSKHKSDIDGDYNAIGTIDKKGNWVNKLKTSPLIDCDLTYENAKYLGCGMFAILDKGIFYNSNNQKIFYYKNLTLTSPSYNKRYAEIKFSNDICYTIGKYIYKSETAPDKEIFGEENSLISIDCNGNLKKLGEANRCKNEIALNIKLNQTTQKYEMNIKSLATNKSATFSAYNIQDAFVLGNSKHHIFTILNEGDKQYITVINADGTMLFKPVEINIDWSRRILVSADDNGIILVNTEFMRTVTVDYNGNVTDNKSYTDPAGFQLCTPYYDGWALAKKHIEGKYEEYYYNYLDKNGKSLFDN